MSQGEDNAMDYEIRELLDVPSLQQHIEYFSKLAGVNITVMDSRGFFMAGFGIQASCTRLPACCHTSEEQCQSGREPFNLPAGGPQQGTLRCANGLLWIVKPVTIDAQLMGNIIAGPFLNETGIQSAAIPSSGCDGKEDCSVYLERVPIKSLDQVENTMATLMYVLKDRMRERYHSPACPADEFAPPGRLGRPHPLATSNGYENIKAIFDSMNDFVCVVNLQGFIVLVNASLTRTLKYQNDELTGRSIFSLHLSSDLPKAQTVVKGIAEGTNVIIPMSLVAQNGEIIPVETSITKSVWNDQIVYVGICRDMRERLLAAAALHESEEKFSQAFHAIPGFVAISTLHEGRLVEVNEFFLKRTGYTRDEVIGSTTVELGFWSALDRNKMLKLFDHNKMFHNLEVIFRVKSGAKMCASVSGTLITLGGERLLLSFIQDITDRKRLEQQLLQKIEHYKSVSELSSEFAYTVGLEPGGKYRWEWLSGAVQSITGYTTEEISRHHYLDFVYETDQPHFRAFLQRLLSGAAGSLEFRLVGKNGDLLWVKHFMHPVWDYEKGRAVKIHGVARDITLEKFAEGAYKESERKFRELSENLPLGMSLHQDDLFHYVNPSFAQLCGYTVDDLIGKMGPSDIIHPDDWPHLQLALSNSSKTESTQPVYARAIKRDGQEAFWEIYIIKSPIEGRPAYLCTFHDITDRKRIELEKEEAMEAMVKAENLACIATLSAGLSHEINQPLNQIKLIASSLLYWHHKGKSLRQDEIMARIDEIVKGVDRIDDIVHHVRERVQGRHGSKNLCDVNQVIQKVLELLHDQITAHGIIVRTSLGRDIPRILAEQTGMEEIIMNLLVNSIQALDAVEIAQKIIEIHTGGSREVVIEITDNGPGFDEGSLPMLMEPFFTTGTTFRNMGLGLSIVYSLVRIYQGNIVMKNMVPQGACSTLVFPATLTNRDKRLTI